VGLGWQADVQGEIRRHDTAGEANIGSGAAQQSCIIAEDNSITEECVRSSSTSAAARIESMERETAREDSGWSEAIVTEGRQDDLRGSAAMLDVQQGRTRPSSSLVEL
jgi:hypothetical protein